MIDMRVSLKKIYTQIEKNFDGKALAFMTTDDTTSQVSVISNLALLYIREGKRVLILDADVRHDYFPKVFNFNSSRGLIELLTDEKVNYNNYIHKISDSGDLSILPSNGEIGKKESALDFDNISSIYADLEEQYDVVLINIQPRINLNNIFGILKITDGIILTSEVNRTRKVNMHRIIKELIKNDQSIIGYVNVTRSEK